MALITVNQLQKQFGNETAVKELTFTINKGSCTALLGPNGAGKTTTLKMLAGLVTPTKGSIDFVGMENVDLRNHIGYLPQHPVFYNWMTAREFLIYVGRLAHLTKQAAVQKADELIQLVDLEEAKNRKIGGFSGGMKQRLGIAQTMVHEPKLIMLDEPVSALDPVGRRDVIEMLRELKKQTTIIFATHVLNDAEEVCDEILIIRNGEMALSGTLEQLREQHQQDIITVSVKRHDEKWLEMIQQQEYVMDVKVEKNSITLFVNGVESARDQVLKELVAYQVPVNSFSIGQSSLEDVFMKVVRS
jgi:ABC-2 type transport system ATP-binding protein